MTKKLLLIVLFIIMCMSFFGAVPVGAVKEGVFYYTISFDEAILTDVDTSASGIITVPDSFGGYPLTEIGNSAFMDCTLVTDVLIPEGVIKIRDYAFRNCSALKNVTIPETVESLGGYAFFKCTALLGITIPDSVTEIDRCAFKDCSALKVITLPKNIKEIPEYTFENCNMLKSIKIPANVTKIGSSSFRGCTSLKTVTIPDKVTKIGNSAFRECSALTKITIPSCVTAINQDAFCDCTALQTVYFGGLKADFEAIKISEGNDSFLNAQIILSDGSILNDDSAEDNPDSESPAPEPEPTQEPEDPDCYSYSVSSGEAVIWAVDESISGDVVIPATLGGYPVVGISGFGDCKNITSISIPSTVWSIGYSEFNDCPLLTDIFVEEGNNWYFSIDGVLFRETAFGEKFLECYPMGKTNTSYKLPEDIDVIYGPGISSNYLETITLNKDLVGIHGDFNCKNLKVINIEEGNKDFVVIDGVLFNVSGSNLICYPAKKTDTSYTVPQNVNYICGSAFRHNTYLENVVLPQNLEAVLSYAFSECSSLKTIVVPKSMYEIDYYTFKDCVSLETVYYEGTEEKFNSLYIYSGNNYFKNANIIYNYEYEEESQSSGSYTYTVKDGKVTITAVDTLISGNAVIIPDVLDGYAVTAIGSSAFLNCSNLTSITLPDSITSIGNQAFDGCSSLATVYYHGTEKQFNEIIIEGSNAPFVNAEKIFFQCVTFDGYSVKLIDTKEDCKIILALYAGNKLVDMQPVRFEFEDINFTSTKSYDTAKILLWEDLQNCIPVTEAIILNEQ
ncbi:MAG: leucine-rich repeat domain-containing protein [Clostridia bacterium]|nr:leucine-rich repeat domain-containing protein [Clostridia bacterium]